MNKTQIRIQENASRGVARSEAFLLDGFWLLRRSVDIDGADLLIQDKDYSAGANGRNSFGLVQVKYFEQGTQISIPSEYLRNNKGGRYDFFVLLHTEDELGNPVYFFFTAKECLSVWKTPNNNESFKFSVTKDHPYSSFKNISKDVVFEKIRLGLSEARHDEYRFAVRMFFDIHVDTRNDNEKREEGEYIFRLVEGCPIALYRGENNSMPRPIEPRRDLYEYTGYFAWGYRGTGPQFLVHSVLGHFLGRAPNDDQVFKLLTIVDCHNETENWEISVKELKTIIGK